VQSGLDLSTAAQPLAGADPATAARNCEGVLAGPLSSKPLGVASAPFVDFTHQAEGALPVHRASEQWPRPRGGWVSQGCPVGDRRARLVANRARLGRSALNRVREEGRPALAPSSGRRDGVTGPCEGGLAPPPSEGACEDRGGQGREARPGAGGLWTWPLERRGRGESCWSEQGAPQRPCGFWVRAGGGPGWEGRVHVRPRLTRRWS
jgi:hypothetical protein